MFDSRGDTVRVPSRPIRMGRGCLAGVLCLALIGAIAASALARTWSSDHPRSAIEKNGVQRRTAHTTTGKLHGCRASSSARSQGRARILLGQSVVQPKVDTSLAGVAEAFAFVSEGTGKVSSFEVYVGARNRAKRLIIGLYSGTACQPRARLATGKLPSLRSSAWNAVNVIEPATVRARITYWLVVLGKGGTLSFRDREGRRCTSQASRVGDVPALPSRWLKSEVRTRCALSAYVSSRSAGAPGLVTGAAAPTMSIQPSLAIDQPVVGTALTVGTGIWTNSPTSYSYQWQRCPLRGPCANIARATGSRYTPVAGDRGDNIVVDVTAGNAGGSTSAFSVFSLPVEPSGNRSRTFYIDHASGSDSESGTSKSSPWQSVPGSPAFTGTYSHQAGDRFIFKGGVTWPSTEFPIHDVNGGVSGNPDYYGVDPTWYSGASWSRPIWDAGGSSAVGTSGCSASFMKMDAAYEVLDGFEMRDVYLGCTSHYNWVDTTSANQVVDNIYGHDWVRGGAWSDRNDSFYIVEGGQNNEFINGECSGLDATNSGDAGECSLADIDRGDGVVSMPNELLPFCGSQTSYEEVSHSTLGKLNASFDGAHENMIESNSAHCKTHYIYNDVFTDELTGVEVFLGNPPGFSGTADSVAYYDNVSYWTVGQNNFPLYMDCRNGDAVTLAAYNNTIYSQGGAAIGQITNGTSCGNAIIENNHFINTNATGYRWSTGTVAASHNCVQSSSRADGQGYTSTHRYAPTANTGCTVGTGLDLSATIPALDVNGSGRPRGAWDEGAYQYHSGSPPW